MFTARSSESAVPPVFSIPTNRNLLSFSGSDDMFDWNWWGGQSLNSTNFVQRLWSHSKPEIAGTNSGPTPGLILVTVWHVKRMTRSWSTANFPSLFAISPSTPYLRLDAHLADSVFFAVAFSSLYRGYALSNNVESDSTTIMLDFPKGSQSGGCTSKASRCANVGASKRWNLCSHPLPEVSKFSDTVSVVGTDGALSPFIMSLRRLYASGAAVSAYD